MISLQCKDSQESSPAPQFKSINSSALSLLYGPAFTSAQTTGKTIALTIWTFVSKVMSLFFICCLGLLWPSFQEASLISWLQSPSDMTLEPNKIKSVTVSIFSPSICHEVMERDAMIFSVLNVEYQASFFTLLFHLHQEAL